MQTGLIAIELISKINQVPIDIRSVIREYALGEAELKPEELVRVLKNLDYKVKKKRISFTDAIGKYPLPSILILDDQSFCVLLKVDVKEQKALIFEASEADQSKQTRVLTFEELAGISTGDMIVLSHKMMTAQVKFGFKWFYSEIIKYKRVLTEVLLGSFVVQLFGLVIPLFTQVILDKVITHRSMTTLDVLAVAFIAIMLFEFCLNLTRNYIFTHTANKIDAKLGAKLFRHLFALPFSYFESRRVGNIVARVRELDTIREFITNKSVSVIIDLIFSVVFLGMMLLYSVKLTLVVVAFIIAIAILYLLITPSLRERLETKFQMGAQSNSYLVESTTGIQTVKSMAIEGSMQKRWEDHLGNYLKSGFELAKLNHVASALSTMLQKGMTITILYLGVKLVIENQLTIGQLIAFQMFAGQLTQPILRLVNLWNEFQQTLLAVDRLSDILHHPTEIQSSQAITLPKIDGAIQFDNISFRYSPEAPYVLSNLSLDVKPGMSIGLVGRSGSGKSTITKLIQRLYIPQEGHISLDGIDTRHLNAYWLRHHIGVVLQESYLFSGTIRENIAMPKPDASIELIIQAAQVAGAHEFITQLSEGYDTQVGERGSALSGGQKQRIAIARALITNPRILIFDEATSALDAESERIIQDNLNQIREGRTLFIISHRLSNVIDCDQILVMEQGQIIESGTHTELLRAKGPYYSLYTQQDNRNLKTDSRGLTHV